MLELDNDVFSKISVTLQKTGDLTLFMTSCKKEPSVLACCLNNDTVGPFMFTRNKNKMADPRERHWESQMWPMWHHKGQFSRSAHLTTNFPPQKSWNDVYKGAVPPTATPSQDRLRRPGSVIPLIHCVLCFTHDSRWRARVNLHSIENQPQAHGAACSLPSPKLHQLSASSHMRGFDTALEENLSHSTPSPATLRRCAATLHDVWPSAWPLKVERIRFYLICGLKAQYAAWKYVNKSAYLQYNYKSFGFLYP